MGNASTSTSGENQDETKTSSSSGGGCPVIHSKGGEPGPVLVENNYRKPADSGGCPVKHGGEELPPISIRVDPRNMMPVTPENYEKKKTKQSHVVLSKTRRVSSIPKADFTPKHQDKEKGGREEKWVYPSEQMFYNAMARKGWDPNASDMKSVVQIHNAVNERTWSELLKWEKLRTVDGDSARNAPRLVRFQGRPTDLSPKALFKMYVLGYTKPFDRHDWYVDRGEGTERIRYVIDFYSGNISTSSEKEGGSSNPMMKNDGRIGFHLDVRPSLDSFESIKCRVKGLFE